MILICFYIVLSHILRSKVFFHILNTSLYLVDNKLVSANTSAVNVEFEHVSCCVIYIFLSDSLLLLLIL